MEVLTALFQTIPNANLESFKNILKRLPVNELDDPLKSRLLNDILVVCSEYRRKDFLPFILSFFFPDQELYDISPITALFLDPLISVRALTFVAVTMEESYMLVIQELIKRNQGEEEVFAAKRALEVFGERTADEWKSLVEYADETGNEFMSNYLGSLLEKVNEFAPVPEWVKDFGMKSAPEISGETLELNVDALVEDILNGFQWAGIEIEEDKEKIKRIVEAKWRLGTNEEKQRLFEEFIKKKTAEKLENDIDVFRWYGPNNPLYGESSFMFTADDYDYDEDSERTLDWFRGACDICHRRIRKRVHAVRMPFPMGGWYGCYCSFPCLRKAQKYEEYDKMEIDMLAEEMINTLEEELFRNGIQDR
jgi:hypothetical protein